MLKGLITAGKGFAQEFVDSDQDVFVMTADVDGQQVTVTAKFSPRERQVSGEDVWELIRPKNTNRTLI